MAGWGRFRWGRLSVCLLKLGVGGKASGRCKEGLPACSLGRHQSINLPDLAHLVRREGITAAPKSLPLRRCDCRTFKNCVMPMIALYLS